MCRNVARNLQSNTETSQTNILNYEDSVAIKHNPIDLNYVERYKRSILVD